MGKFCFIVPYRQREQHLARFVPHYRSLFPDAPIYVIEQADNRAFNRGKLLNIGAVLYGFKYEYFCLSDVDMYVTPETADYSFPENPTHLATQCSQFGYNMPYADYFGGVNLFSADQFKAVNGFSNNLWGWGAEDDLLRKDFIRLGFTIDRRPCRFECADHPRNINRILHQNNVNLMARGRGSNDGVAHCTYLLKAESHLEGYTHTKVSL